MLRNCFWHNYYESKEPKVIESSEDNKSSVMTVLGEYFNLLRGAVRKVEVQV